MVEENKPESSSEGEQRTMSHGKGQADVAKVAPPIAP